MNSIIMYNKKGNYGKQVIAGLVIIFIVVFLFLIFNPIMNLDIGQRFIALLEPGEEAAGEGILFTLGMFKKIMFTIIGIVLLYLLIRIVKREPQEVYR